VTTPDVLVPVNGITLDTLDVVFDDIFVYTSADTSSEFAVGDWVRVGTGDESHKTGEFGSVFSVVSVSSNKIELSSVYNGESQDGVEFFANGPAEDSSLYECVVTFDSNLGDR
jgi:hypothetical protein